MSKNRNQKKNQPVNAESETSEGDQDSCRMRTELEGVSGTDNAIWSTGSVVHGYGWTHVMITMDETGVAMDVGRSTSRSNHKPNVTLGHSVYIGGYGQKTLAIESLKQFKGCLRDFTINGVNVFQKVRAGQLGSVNLPTCPNDVDVTPAIDSDEDAVNSSSAGASNVAAGMESVVSGISKLGQAAFTTSTAEYSFDGKSHLTYPTPTSNPGGRVTLTFSFRSEVKDGVIFYSVTNASEALVVELHYDRLYLRHYVVSGVDNMSWSSGLVVDRDKWTGVTITMGDTGIVMKVGSSRTDVNRNGNVQLGCEVYIGGYGLKNVAIESNKQFSGCLRDFTLNGVNVFQKAQTGSLGPVSLPASCSGDDQGSVAALADDINGDNGSPAGIRGPVLLTALLLVCPLVILD